MPLRLGVRPLAHSACTSTASDVGLSATTENIDALEVLPDGKVLISTTGNPVVTGVTGAADEDILAFTPDHPGHIPPAAPGQCTSMAQMSGWLIPAMKILMPWMWHPMEISIYPPLEYFAVTGVSGADEDVFICAAHLTGKCHGLQLLFALYFDGSTWGQTSNDVDGFNLLNTGPFPTATPSNTPTQRHRHSTRIQPTTESTPTPT